MTILFPIVFLLSLIGGVLLTPIVRRFSIAKGFIDQPGGRHIHQQPVARLGGVGIFLSFWLVIVSLLLLDPAKLRFVNESVSGLDKNLLGVFLGSLILVFVGIWDDVRGVRPLPKLFWQFLAASMPVLFGVRIWWLSNPLGGLNIVLGDWTYLVVPLWIVLVVNVMNWLDGLDGLAVGVAVIASLNLGFLSLLPFVNQASTALLAFTLAGVGLGFLPYNFHPAKIFLGDSGSQFLGYMIAIFAIISGGKLATAGLVLGVPILDALWVVLRRLTARQVPWQADRLHLHHRLLDLGFGQRGTVIFYWAVALIFGMIALSSKTAGKVVAAGWLIAAMVIVALTVSLAARILPYGKTNSLSRPKGR